MERHEISRSWIANDVEDASTGCACDRARRWSTQTPEAKTRKPQPGTLRYRVAASRSEDLQYAMHRRCEDRSNENSMAISPIRLRNYPDSRGCAPQWKATRHSPREGCAHRRTSIRENLRTQLELARIPELGGGAPVVWSPQRRERPIDAGSPLEWPTAHRHGERVGDGEGDAVGGSSWTRRALK